MNPNLKFSERVAILATLDSASVAASTVVSGWVSVANYHSICALIDVGAFGASATVDAKLRQAQDSSGTGQKDIANKAITQLLAAGGNNRQATIECRSEDLDQVNGFGYVALSVTVGVAATQLAAVVFGVNPRFFPASAQNQTGVAQQV